MNRHFSSAQGRFMQVDPIGMASVNPMNPQTLNLYAYVGNDPVNRVDPLGLFEQAAWVSAWRDMMEFMFRAMAHHESSGVGGGENEPQPYDAGDLGEVTVTADDEEVEEQKKEPILSKAAKDLSKKKLDKENCQKDLAALGVTAELVRAGAEAANIVNGVGSTVRVSRLYAASPNEAVRRATANSTETVGERLAKSGTIAVAQLGGPNIYANPAMINPRNYYQNLGTVLHEVLHNVTGITDPDIQRKLSLKENEPSNNITQKLIRDCL